MRRFARRFVRIAVALVIYFVALEICLQAAAAIARHVTGREIGATWLAGKRRILCVGDSNTYGLYLERAEAYPQQLEALWNEAHRRPQVEVVNMGFPGLNSSRLLREYPHLLDTFGPQMVVALIGANDFWTVAVPVAPVSESGFEPGRFLRSHSRVYKLLYMLRRWRDSRELEVEHFGPTRADELEGTFRYGDEEFQFGWKRRKPDSSPDGLSRLAAIRSKGAALEENLGEIARLTRDAGSELILLTYAAGHSAPAVGSRFLRRFAAEADVSLVDLAPVFAPLCPTRECPAYFLPDKTHPNARGYRLVAETVAARLADAWAAP
jgi:lysophospholipase L1-like esterase